MKKRLLTPVHTCPHMFTPVYVGVDRERRLVEHLGHDYARPEPSVHEQ